MLVTHIFQHTLLLVKLMQVPFYIWRESFIKWRDLPDFHSIIISVGKKVVENALLLVNILYFYN